MKSGPFGGQVVVVTLEDEEWSLRGEEWSLSRERNGHFVRRGVVILRKRSGHFIGRGVVILEEK